MGDRLTQATDQGSNVYSYDAAHRLIEVNGQTYTWDDNGNLLDDGERSFTYDHADRLIAVSGQPSAFSFGYDGMGNRYQQTQDAATTTFSLDLAAGLTQVLSDGSNASLYGLGRIGEDGSGGWGYHLGDALGSVRQIADGSGKLTLTQSFEPFGAAMASSGEGSSGFGFTGEQDGIAGLVYLRARFYDANVGRFLTKDPFSGFASLPSTLNPYAYALNNPTTLVDPSGQNPLLIAAAVGAIIGMVGGAVSYMISNPGADLGDMLGSACFWQSVLVGGLAGFVSAAVGWLFNWATPFIYARLGLTSVNAIFGASIISGFISEALSAGAFQIISNLLLGNQWNSGLGSALSSGGIIGGITGGLGFKIRQWIGTGALEKYLFQALSKKKGAGDLVVIGKYIDDYIGVGHKLDAKVFSIPPAEWKWLGDMGGEAAQWAANEGFLTRAVGHGDTFFLASLFETGWKEIETGFKNELLYLLSEGLEIFSRLDTEWLIPSS